MKRFYDRVHKYYGGIERSLGPVLDRILEKKIEPLPGRDSMTVLEYACGSGLLSLKLARLFKSVDGRDSSVGMIGRAESRGEELGIGNVSFRTGNILEPDEAPGSFDYVFVSFALHLFSPDEIPVILGKLLAIAREAVVIIDHGRKWEFLTALVEWFEGGYYDKFIKMDFAPVSASIGSSRLEEEQISECTVLVFGK